MKTKTLALLLLMSPLAQAGWTPPPNPEPKAILHEAYADAKERRYEDALAKHLWFHENALKHERSQYGVRLSFALSAWHRLGEAYPPALEKLKAIREANERAIREGSGGRETFNDFESINRELGEQERTTGLFVWLDANRPELAKETFDLSLPALTKSKEYALAGKYLDPVTDYEDLTQNFRHTSELAKQPRFGDRLKQHAEKSFSNKTATLVALLVKNGRQGEAEALARKATTELNTPEFKEEITKALTGAVPEPWP